MDNVVNVHEFKTHYSKYMALVKKGQTITVAERGKPFGQLAPLPQKVLPRKPGILAGKIWIDDDFDDPMPELIAAMEEDIDANTT